MPRKKKEPPKTMGRPKLEAPPDETVAKLETAFQNGFNVQEACWVSEIVKDTYYRWLKTFPDFNGRMERAQGFATMKAKQVVVTAINNGDAKQSSWWLERKARNEFATKNHTEDDGETSDLDDARQEIIKLVKELKGGNTPAKKRSRKKVNKKVLQDRGEASGGD